MKNYKTKHAILLLISIIGIAAVIGCAVPNAGVQTLSPTVVSTSPLNLSAGVALNTLIKATFSKEMKPATIIASNFTVYHGAVAVPGVVTYDVATKTATFAPTANLIGSGTVYTVTVKKAVQDANGNKLLANKVWTFSTTVVGLGPAPVVLGTAANYVILAKTGVSTVVSATFPSNVTGAIGLSPGPTSGITGFSLTYYAPLHMAISAQVTGLVYASDMTAPTPANLTAAVLAMQAAYTDAFTRPAATGANLNKGGGTLSGMTLAAGLYTWGTNVTIPTDLTFQGSANDVWIMQVSGTLSLSNAKHIILIDGAQAKNIFWEVTGAVTLGTTSHFEGIILGKTAITLNHGATMIGQAYAQTAVALDYATMVTTNP